ncbi:MAG: TonB-dependent receptor [Rubricoccaceae bacterium]
MNRLLPLLCLSLLAAAGAAAQGTIQGVITDANTRETLPGVNVLLVGTSYGATTGASGRYAITNVPAGTYTARATFVGYAAAETQVVVRRGETVTLNLGLAPAALNLGELTVVSASRRGEKITDAPATIGVISRRAIDESAGNVGELVARVKGVDYVRAGVVGTGFNVRGFSSAFNPKNLQINDGRLSSLIATGLPLGALSTTVKEDIERVEVVLGPTAALYGPNAHNGLVSIITRDPRTSPGTTVVAGGGSQNVLTTRARHAQVLSERMAFKLAGAFSRGTEFDYVDSVYVGTTAFEELELDRDFRSLAGEASFYYSPAADADVILTYGGSLNSNLGVTNAGRNQIKDWQIHLLQARYVSPRLFAQAYHTWSITDDTYAINQRTQNYQLLRLAGVPDEEARARSFTQQPVFVAGQPLRNPDGSLFTVPRGALFRDNSRRLNAEVQYNQPVASARLTGGVQFQRDMADSRGTYLLDADGININQFGLYAQADAPLAAGFRTVIAARADNHELYGFNFVPKAALLYDTPIGTFRATYGRGIAAPTILNLSGNLFGGLVLGNGVGFTLSDGSTVAALTVETIQTFEAGYKGILGQRWFVDANAYYNMSKNFLSPLVNIATQGRTVTQRGSRPISDFQNNGAFVLTYLNFGAVDTYGADLGVSFYPTPWLDLALNYSYFDFSLDTDDPANDGNRDGRVDANDLPINTPRHKASFAVGARQGAWFGSVFTRWVEAYDFFSGINVAARTNPDLVYNGSPVIEGQRVGRDFNEGPLGGFVNVDLGLGYRLSPQFTLAGQVTNVFDAQVREFVASPAIGRMVGLELRVNL